MTLIVKPFTFTAGTKAKASEVNSDFDTIYTCVNGAVGEANVTYVTASDGLRVARVGPNAGGTNGNRLCVLSQNFTMAGAAASGNVAYTFTTHAVYGNPAFSATPTICGIAMFVTGVAAPDTDNPHLWVSAITSTTLTLQWDRSLNAGGTTNAQAITVTISLLGNV